MLKEKQENCSFFKQDSTKGELLFQTLIQSSLGGGSIDQQMMIASACWLHDKSELTNYNLSIIDNGLFRIIDTLGHSIHV
jgi:hypothetical protein